MPTDIELQLSKFFACLNAGLESVHKVRESYNEQMAFDFCATRDFFWPNENTTSRVLAFFLNPSANHGQKNTFLKIFINHLEERISKISDEMALALRNCINAEMIRVATEEHTEGSRRIDIVIAFGVNGKNFIIGIENKIGATDQESQISDYSKELNERTGGKYLLIYLTPDGRSPSENSIKQTERELLEKKCRFLKLSYKSDIIKLFEEFEQGCKADCVKAFLRDFTKHLKIQHVGVSEMDEKNVIKKSLMENPEILKFTKPIEICAEEVRIECIQNLVKCIWNHMSKDYACSSINEEGLLFYVNKKCDDVPIAVCYDNEDFFCAIDFIVDGKPDQEKIGKYNQKIADQLAKANPTQHNDWWPAGWFAFNDEVDRFSLIWASNTLREKSIEKQAKALAEKIQRQIENISMIWNSQSV